MQRLSLPLRGGWHIACFRQFHAAPAAMLPLLIRRTAKELMGHDFKDWAFGYVACVGRASPGSSSARRGSNQVVREDLPGRLLESKGWKRRDIFLHLLFVHCWSLRSPRSQMPLQSFTNATMMTMSCLVASIPNEVLAARPPASEAAGLAYARRTMHNAITCRLHEREVRERICGQRRGREGE